MDVDSTTPQEQLFTKPVPPASENFCIFNGLMICTRVTKTIPTLFIVGATKEKKVD